MVIIYVIFMLGSFHHSWIKILVLQKHSLLGHFINVITQIWFSFQPLMYLVFAMCMSSVHLNGEHVAVFSCSEMNCCKRELMHNSNDQWWWLDPEI